MIAAEVVKVCTTAVLPRHGVAEPNALPHAVVLVVLGLLVRVRAVPAVAVRELADLLQQEPVGVGEDTLQRHRRVGPPRHHPLESLERLVRLAVGILHRRAPHAVLTHRRDAPAQELLPRGVDPTVHVGREERLGVQFAIRGGAVDAGVRLLSAGPVVEATLHVLAHVLVGNVRRNGGFLQLAEGVDEVDGLGARRCGGRVRGEHLRHASRRFRAVHPGRQRGESNADGQHARVLDDVIGANLAAQAEAELRQAGVQPRVAPVIVVVGVVPVFAAFAEEHGVVAAVARPRGGLQVVLQRADRLGRKRVAPQNLKSSSAMASAGARTCSGTSVIPLGSSSLRFL